MEDLAESIENIKNYLKKLLRIIEYDTKFSFGNCRFVDKTKIDDIICCIDASFPANYKKWLKYATPRERKKITSDIAYTKLKNIAQNKIFFNNNYYSTNIIQVRECVNTISANIEHDFSYVYKFI